VRSEVMKVFKSMQGFDATADVEPANAERALTVNENVRRSSDAWLHFDASPSDYLRLLAISAQEATSRRWTSSMSS
jgi:hypothetical protein